MFLECPICLELFALDDLIKLRPCQHTFCSSCLGKQLKRESRCAICRVIFFDTTPPLFDPTNEVRSVVLSRRPDTGRFGLSLHSRSRGIWLRGVEWRHLWHRGLCSGMEVLGLNGLPCLSITAVMQVLNMEGLHEVVLHVRRWLSCKPRSRGE